MSLKRIQSLTILIISILVFSGCHYDKILKSDDFDLKYEKAKEYYNEGDYARALPLLDQLLTVKIGTPDEKQIRYYMAYCYYGQGDFITASGLFRQVFSIFPLTPEAEECLYMSANSLYTASPRFELDQSISYKAIDAFQYFLDVYPKSSLADKANERVDILRAKLEEKLIASAELYYNTQNYLAAAVTYKNVLTLYPDTKDAEAINFKILSSYFNYAGQSVTCRKEERYDMAINSYNDYLAKYPEGSELDQAKGLYDRSIDLKQKAINEINTYKINCDEYTKKD